MSKNRGYFFIQILRIDKRKSIYDFFHVFLLTVYGLGHVGQQSKVSYIKPRAVHLVNGLCNVQAAVVAQQKSISINGAITLQYKSYLMKICI